MPKVVLAQNGIDVIENGANRRVHADVLFVDQSEAPFVTWSKGHAVKHVVPVEVYCKKYRDCDEGIVANDYNKAKTKCRSKG